MALEQIAQHMAGLVKDRVGELREVWGGEEPLFVLILFTKGEGGWSTYCSDAERESMILALEEMLSNLKKGLDKQ